MEQTNISSATARRTLALVCAAFLAAGVTLSGVGPALPLLALHIEQDIAVLGGLFTAISLGIILTQFGAGLASARFGQRFVLAVGMLLMGCGGSGVTFGRSLPILLAGALLFGIGFGGVLAAGNVLVGQLFPTRSAAALNGVNLFFGVGSMLGPAIAGLAGCAWARHRLRSGLARDCCLCWCQSCRSMPPAHPPRQPGSQRKNNRSSATRAGCSPYCC